MKLPDKRYRFGYATLTTLLPPFMTTFIKLNANIQFTKEIEENGKLPFLDCLLSRDNNELRTTVTENRRILTDYLTNHLTTRLHAKPRLDFDERRAASL